MIVRKVINVSDDHLTHINYGYAEWNMFKDNSENNTRNPLLPLDGPLVQIRNILVQTG